MGGWRWNPSGGAGAGAGTRQTLHIPTKQHTATAQSNPGETAENGGEKEGERCFGDNVVRGLAFPRLHCIISRWFKFGVVAQILELG